MTQSFEDAIHERRRQLGNPYAFVDELEEIAAVRAERRRSENPYSHVEAVVRLGGSIKRFDGVPVRYQHEHVWTPRKKARYTDSEVEGIAHELHTRMWRHRRRVFPDAQTIAPIAMLTPEIGLGFLGFELEFADTLGQFQAGGTLVEVAGTIDIPNKRVQVSTQFVRAVRNFTAAHELGHAALHQQTGLHRDRPLDGSLTVRDRREYEADKFASYFLMPRKLVKGEFELTFGPSPFRLGELTAFALFARAPDARVRAMSERDVSRVISAATRYNGVDIVPLSERFGVSVEAMAIRLEELGLIAGADWCFA